MRVLLESECCGYLLIPCSKKMAAKLEKITGEDSILFQIDWDYPALASRLGWSMWSRDCRHDSTDGTVDCRECGKTASAFISEASEWLSEHTGTVFQNTGADDYVLNALGEY